MAYLKSTEVVAEYVAANDDAAEKEEKKVESEYFIDQLFYGVGMDLFFPVQKKVVIPANNFKLAYFPEVLTPPPAI